MRRILLSLVFALSLFSKSTVFGDDDLFLGDLEEIGSEHAWDHSLNGGRKLDLWREKDNSAEFVEKASQSIIPLEKPYKNQSYSLLKWDDVDPEKFLNIDEWISDAEFQLKKSGWLDILRSNQQLELMGRILSCKGRCFIYRGINKHRGSFSSQIFEGDEFETDQDSVAWIFLNDGTLLRVSPEGSLNFQEINFSKTKIFVKIRLNKGHLFWNSRLKAELPVDLDPETDSHSLPLKILEANQEHFERKLSQNQKDSEQVAEYFNINKSAIKNQIDQISALQEKNKILMEKEGMLVIPNGTLSFGDIRLDAIYLPGGNAYFKSRTESKLNLQLRGYKNNEEKSIQSGNWNEISFDGRDYKEVIDVLPAFNLLELLTKRIKTIELAREIWIQKYSVAILNNLEDRIKLATDYGYNLWEPEKINQRINFLKTEMSRVETSIKSFGGTPLSCANFFFSEKGKGLSDCTFVAHTNTVASGNASLAC